MLLQILTHTPVFVWFLLAGLVTLGWRQSQDRLVAPLQVLALPALMLGLGGWSLASGTAALPVVALAWLGAMALGAAGGVRTPQLPGTAWLAHKGRFRVPGSWVPMGFILFIFTLRYSSNVAFAMHPEWRGALAVQATLAVVLGLVSGLAIGRAIGLLRLMRPVPLSGTASATIATHA